MRIVSFLFVLSLSLTAAVKAPARSSFHNKRGNLLAKGFIRDLKVLDKRRLSPSATEREVHRLLKKYDMAPGGKNRRQLLFFGDGFDPENIDWAQIGEVGQALLDVITQIFDSVQAENSDNNDDGGGGKDGKRDQVVGQANPDSFYIPPPPTNPPPVPAPAADDETDPPLTLEAFVQSAPEETAANEAEEAAAPGYFTQQSEETGKAGGKEGKKKGGKKDGGMRLRNRKL